MAARAIASDSDLIWNEDRERGKVMPKDALTPQARHHFTRFDQVYCRGRGVPHRRGVLNAADFLGSRMQRPAAAFAKGEAAGGRPQSTSGCPRVSKGSGHVYQPGSRGGRYRPAPAGPDPAGCPARVRRYRSAAEPHRRRQGNPLPGADRGGDGRRRPEVRQLRRDLGLRRRAGGLRAADGGAAPVAADRPPPRLRPRGIGRAPLQRRSRVRSELRAARRTPGADGGG